MKLCTPPGEVCAVDLALAGDDTIFVAVKDATAQRRVMRELKKLIATP